jgi:phosphonoacetaldehyde hydrolase
VKKSLPIFLAGDTLMAIRDRFDLVIFDWAGTTVDFGCHAPVIALQEAFARRGITITVAQARRDMGKAKEDHVRALLRDPVVAALWTSVRGAAPDDSDIAALMADLGPLMRDQATRAAHLIDGARATIDALRAQGLKIASSTGYTRDMMATVLSEAAAQGYAPDHLVCSGETPTGRPSPLMIYKACAELGVWPLSRVVKVDDAEPGSRRRPRRRLFHRRPCRLRQRRWTVPASIAGVARRRSRRAHCRRGTSAARRRRRCRDSQHCATHPCAREGVALAIVMSSQWRLSVKPTMTMGSGASHF